MASLFASPDIVALVAAFPPPLPTKHQASLVLSLSGDALLNSNAVLNRFRTLLDTEPQRIRKSDLPHRLGIERLDWLFGLYDGLPQMRWSRDQGSMVPQPVWSQVIDKLQSQCKKEFVNVNSFAVDEYLEDISHEDLTHIKDSHSLESIESEDINFGRTVYLVDGELVRKTRLDIESRVQNVSDEKINLSRLFSTVPAEILKQFTIDMISRDQLELDGDDIIFVPAGYAAAQEQQSEANREMRIQTLLEEFENNDFIVIDAASAGYSSANDAQELFERYTSIHADVEEPKILEVDSASKVLVLPGLLDRTVRELKGEAVAAISNDGDSSITNLDQDTALLLVSGSSEPVLGGTLLRISSYSEEICSVIQEAHSQRQHEQLEKFKVSFHRDLFVPAQLYAAGIETVHDQKLNYSLTEYVATYFKNETIPIFAKSAHESGLLSGQKSKIRETDKFLERSREAKDLQEVLNTMTKLAKKLKLPPPSEEERMLIYRQVLERKAFQDMSRMTRGSDVLQNLVWILLSAAAGRYTAVDRGETFANGAILKTPTTVSSMTSSANRLALFMSPGKDTGRMMKQYSTIASGQAEISTKLTSWRDKLKTESETKEDLEEMRALAKKVVSKMSAENDSTVDAMNSETEA